MADNVTLPGTGAVIATDEATDGTLGTVQFQYVKLVDGTLGGTTKVAAGSNGLKVDGSGVTQPVSGTFWQTTQPVSAATLPLPSGAATSAKQPGLGTPGTASSDVISVQGIASMTALKVDGSGVTQPVSLAAGSNVAGKVGIDQTTPGTTNAVQSIAGTAGGWSVNSQTGLTNTKVAVKASAGNFGGYMIYNPNATVVYIQVFDVASGSVTLGTTTPTYVIPLPATAAANVEFSRGITHATAITLAATTTATGSTAPGTALTGFFLYK